MIASFPDTTTADIDHGSDTQAARKLPRELWGRIQGKLDLLNACTCVEDLRVPPANRSEKLKGDLAYSIRVNERYRIVFRFAAGQAEDAHCVDYHWGPGEHDVSEFPYRTHPGKILQEEFLEPMSLPRRNWRARSVFP